MKFISKSVAGMWPAITKVLLVMKLIAIIMITVFSSVSAKSFSQTVTLHEKNVSVKKILKYIEKQSGYHVILINVNPETTLAGTININLEHATVEEALNECFRNKPITYTIIQGTIIIKKKEEELAAEVKESIDIHGRVIDEKGQPLPGVNVKVKGATIGSITGSQGEYTIKVPDEQTVLIFSYVSFETQEVVVGDKKAINITMKEASNRLSEVIVVGYGTQKKVDLTGAVVTVTGSELNKRVATDPTQLLQGKLPGLSVVQGSGEAGNEGTSLRIRGTGTFSSAGNSPFIIVDGLPGSITALDPQNIESVTVLKDAASASIYGTRAANGVILITTKQGKEGKMQLSYDYNLGITRATSLPKNLIYNSAQYMTLWNQAATNSNYPNKYSDAQIALYTNATDHKLYPDYNWLDAIFNTVKVQTHHLGITGGSNGTTYNVGLGYVDQPDVMLGYYYKKYNIQLNLTSKLNKWATFGSAITLNSSERGYTSRGSQDQFLSALSQQPMYGPILPDGSGRYTNSVFPSVQTPNKNPIAIAKNAINKQNDYYLQSSFYLNIHLLKGLEWRTNGGFNFDYNKTIDFKPVINQYNWFAKPGDAPERTLDVNGQGIDVTDNNSFYPVAYTQFTYSRSINNDHNFKLLAGTQVEYNKSQNLEGLRNLPFASNTLQEIDAGPVASQLTNGTSNIYSLHSYYGRLNYDYQEKYLLEANARYDASSRFPANNRWAFFPSVSLGWAATKEKFLQNVNWLNNLKLRASLGNLGNQNIGNYPYQETYNFKSYYNTKTSYAYPFAGTTVTSGVINNSLTNPNIKWETTRVFDIGTDITVLNNKLSFSFDWYDKLTSGILETATTLTPLYFGLNAPVINYGKMKNTGIEASFEYNDRFGNVGFSFGGNIQANKNTLVSYGAPAISTGTNTINQEGQPYGSFYMLKYMGIFQSAAEIAASPTQQYNPQPGYMKYADTNGDGKVDDSDRVIVPGAYPKFNYAFNTSVNWNNFDLTVFFYGSYGQKLYVNGWGIQPFNQGSPPPKEWLNAWTASNPSTTMPMVYVLGQGNISSNANTASTYYLRDASFLRLKNVQLGYNLPKDWVKHLFMSGLRIYFAGDNLVTFTKFPGLDPERIVSNTRYVTHPQNQVYSFGVRATF
ncbi:SusC/RagA family TonB-linked outer membrane protein [Mucilaginibacter sp. Mucisp84]|uniref:SusC/RagA family TonB-linked outer membrane protein n=1 Tax=Mucilaginibacter sp. Mucisp84 TaxID=3243058 RepID=UPI0039A48A33